MTAHNPPSTITINSDDGWPEGISDGLTLPCAQCGIVPVVDYIVDDDFWQRVVPAYWRLGVVCLSCLSQLAATQELTVGEHLVFVQLTEIGTTCVLVPQALYKYEPSC